MKEEIEIYLARKSTRWLESELEQAHALLSDESAGLEKRESALAASVMLASELTRRMPTTKCVCGFCDGTDCA